MGTCGEQGIAFVPFHAIAGAGRTAGARGADAAGVRAVARAVLDRLHRGGDGGDRA